MIEKLAVHPINVERLKEGKNMANVMLLRGIAVKLELEKFSEKFGVEGFSICPTPIINGLTRSI